MARSRYADFAILFLGGGERDDPSPLTNRKRVLIFAGVPESATHLLRFIQRVHATNAQTAQEAHGNEAPDSPILLHCSAGVGRTGTFIAISSLLPVLALQARGELSAPTSSTARSESAHPLGPYPADELLQSTEGDSAGAAGSSSAAAAAAARADARDLVGATIDGLRDQRTTMAQTSEQVAWVFDCLREAWRSGSYDDGPSRSA